MMPVPRARRLASTDRSVVRLDIDGTLVEALEGDTLLTAILLSGGQTGTDSFNQTKQAGFCLMGTCQSCWVWVSDTRRVRACDMEVQEGLRVFTTSERIGW